MPTRDTETRLRLALLEREHELEVGRETLDAASGGAGQVLAIGGAAGIGKSTLLRAIAELPAAARFDRLFARGSELERECSFGIVLQLLAAPVRELVGDEREALFRDAATLARPLFEGDPAPRGWGADDRRFQLFHGLHWLVAGLAERRPLLLAVDDAQWADEPSLSFLSYLATRLDDLPVCLLLCTREGSTAAAPPALAQLAARSSRPLRLSPLSDAGARELIRLGLPEAGEALCAACLEATGGNPFYLAEMARALRSGEIPLAAEAPHSLPTPELVADAVPRRIRELGTGAWELAEAIAALDDPAPLRLAARLADLEPGRAAALADSLRAAELLAAVDPAGFAHPIVAAAVRAEIPTGRLESLHLRAARLLEAEEGNPDQVAALALRATRGESVWLTEVLRGAARRARSRGAPAAAIGFLSRALEEAVDRERRGVLLAELGLSEAEAGEERGRLALGESVELLADSRARGRALYDLAVVHGHGGRYALLRDAAERGLAELGDEDPDLRSELAALAAQGHAWTELTDRDGSVRRLREVFELPGAASGGGGRLALASASVRSAFGGATAIEVTELARRSVASFGPSDHPFAAAIFPLAALALTFADELELAETIAAAGLDGARRRGSILDLGAASHVRSQVHFHAGRIAEAIADAEQAVEAGRRGWGATLPMAHAILARGLLERGQLDEAEAALELPGGEERWLANASYGAHVLARGELLRARGEAEQALERILFAGKMAELAGVTNPVALPWRPSAAALLAAAGKRDQADSLLAEEERFALEFGAARGIGVATRARAELLDGEDRVACLQRAVEVLERSPSRLEHARTLIELGAALRREGRRREARQPLREGTDAAHRCGGTALVARGMEELRMAGARPRRPAASGAAALTPGESRIAALAAQGDSNREIAQALFLTRRTVEMHLSNAYRKLGIGSREELPDALGDRQP